MRKSLSVLLVAGLVLSACGWRDSRLNPGNWFGRSQPAAAQDGAPVNPLIPSSGATGMFSRPEEVDGSEPIPVVSELVIERTASGAIVRATGEAARLGPYNAWLRAEGGEGTNEDGVIVYSFRITYPRDATPVGTPNARKVVVARSLSRKQLEGVRAIRVVGAQNARESRRN